MTGITEFAHGSDGTLAQVENLTNDIQTALNKGDKEEAARLAATAKQTAQADKRALGTASLVDQYGSSLVKTVPLFMPGKTGYGLSAIAYACDSARPGDSFSSQMIDAGLGMSKGLALKGSFEFIGKQNLDIAGKAVSLGISSRVSDLALSRQTYQDGNGGYSFLGGAEKTVRTAFAPSALASDVVTFGIAHGVLGRVNAATGGALNSNPFWSTVATGGVFGLSSGSVQEISRQSKAGERFDLSKVVTSALLTGATDMVAAAPGGKMISMRSQAEVAARTTDGQPADKVAPARTGEIKRNFLGSNSREFQLVNGDLQITDLLRSTSTKSVYTPVQEVKPSGELGPVQNLLVQHLAKGVALQESLAKQADLLATCNRALLPESMRSKHVLPSAQEGLWLTQAAGGRLRFSSFLPESSAGTDSLKLGPVTVSELLLNPKTPERLRDMHDVAGMGQAMRHFKPLANQVLDGGADSVVVELADRRILKITDKAWNPEWGHREIWTPNGQRIIDASIIGKPQKIELPNSEGTYYLQPRARTPVKMDHLQALDAMIEQDGTYKFWDNDFDWHGLRQLGYEPLSNGKSRLVVIDYDSVREPHLVPKHNGQSAKSWWPGRYLADMYD